MVTAEPEVSLIVAVSSRSSGTPESASQLFTVSQELPVPPPSQTKSVALSITVEVSSTIIDNFFTIFKP